MFNHSATKAFIATLFAAVVAMGCEDSGVPKAGERLMRRSLTLKTRLKTRVRMLKKTPCRRNKLLIQAIFKQKTREARGFYVSNI